MDELNTSVQMIYDTELKKAIISGTGSEEAPYVVDYSLAPNFEKFVIGSYNSKTETSKDGSFTQHILTKKLGTYTSGGLWTYKSGGLKVSADGNLRVVKVVYLSEQQANELYIVKSKKTVWNTIVETISDISSFTNATIITAIVASLKKIGIASVDEYTAKSIGEIVAKAVAAFGIYTGVKDLWKKLIDSNEESQLYNAVSVKKNFVNIYYLTSYHGEWYSHTTSETGWSNNVIYIPSSTYGEGIFITK